MDNKTKETLLKKIEKHLRMLVILKLMDREDLVGGHLFSKDQEKAKISKIAVDYIDNIDDNELK